MNYQQNTYTNVPNTLYFEDGVSKIDAVLVYKAAKEGRELHTFLQNLERKGLQLKLVPLQSDPSIIFIKIHAPYDVLIKYGKKYGVSFRKDQTIVFPRSEIPYSFMETILNAPQPDPNHPVSKRAWATVSKQKPIEITAPERSEVVFTIMNSTLFSNNGFDVGVRQLLHEHFILDAYPLHDGPWEWNDNITEPLNDRQLLAQYWSNFLMIYKEQPLGTVKHYFGYEIAIYFAYLGFYVKMLVIASIMGVFVFLSGHIYVIIFNMEHLDAFCNHTGIMCSTVLIEEFKKNSSDAIKNADKISSNCSFAYTTYRNSNLVTFLYSVAMVLWCTVFKERWKRLLNVYNAKWDNPVNEDFILRPQFRANAKDTRPHIYTGEPELYIPIFEQFWRYLFSAIGVTLMISVVIGSNYGIIELEYYLLTLHYSRMEIINITSFVSLICMSLMETIFNNNVLKILAQTEMPQTQLDYEKSIIAKSIIFLFFNSYGRLIYIAFIKGKIHPSHEQLPFEYCLPPGCEYEVMYLLGIILVVKPIAHNIADLLIKYIRQLLKQVKTGSRDPSTPRWECDYALSSLDLRYILSELNKLIIQFGLVTFFAASFSLAPLIALIHNLIKLRLDATRVVKFYKRAVERKRVTSICMGFDIFETMCHVAIIINALYMAYTCKFVHVFYDYFRRKTRIEDPVVFNEFSELTHFMNGQPCFLSGLYSYNETRITFNVEHYDLLAFKAYLALSFMLLAFLVSGLISYVIPDVPRELLEFIKYHEDEEKKKKFK